jgi:hypothetical protein
MSVRRIALGFENCSRFLGVIGQTVSDHLGEKKRLRGAERKERPYGETALETLA